MYCLDKYDKEQTVGCILKTIKGVTGVMIKPEPTLSLSSVAGAFGSSTGTVSGYTGEIISLTLHFWIPEGGDTLVSEAMLALRISHSLILNAVDLRLKYAPLATLQEGLEECKKDFAKIWDYPPPI